MHRTLGGLLCALENKVYSRFNPRLVVVQIGGKEIPNAKDPTKLAASCKTLGQRVRTYFPKSKIILTSVLCRNGESNFATMRSLNEALRTQADDQAVFYVDLESGFLDAATGVRPALIQDDKLTPLGYQRLGDTLKPLVNRILDSSQSTPQPSKATTKPTPATPLTNINDPAFQTWMNDVQSMSPADQVKAVSQKLIELNPGFPGVQSHVAENNVVIELKCVSNKLTDVAPIRALAGLRTLLCRGASSSSGILKDLSPLRGMSISKLDIGEGRHHDLATLNLPGLKLTSLNCGYSFVNSLEPLRGIPLTELFCNQNSIRELSPLQGMPLAILDCGSNNTLSDLTPLRGMPLTTLRCASTSVTDLSPLAECKNLTSLNVTRTKVTPAAVAALQQALPNCKIAWDDPDKATTK